MKKWWIFSGILIVIGAAFLIPANTQPSDDTRIILEHEQHTYIAPVCFEEAQPSNWISEDTLERAEDLDYPPNDTCTEEALAGVKDPFFISLLKDVGIMDKKWDNW
ncbi:hypothetical protein [Virgibacillus sediminis]|uniref:Uncharacterized protein n=1 Tax=Virgibacillus sediminis TaxID=202260 RepID=A0ABV7ABX2_9BACI